MVTPKHDDVADRALRALGGPAVPPADLADRAFRAAMNAPAPSLFPSFVDDLLALARPAAALACSAAVVLLGVAAVTSSSSSSSSSSATRQSEELVELGLPTAGASLDEVAAEILPIVNSGGSRT